MIDEAALKPGDMIGEYRIDKVLGAGSFGVTYLATDPHLSRRVAIKEYMPGEYARRDGTGRVSSRNAESAPTFEWGLDRFTAEARTLAQFSHPNIVRVLHIVQNLNGTAYIVMELLEGRDFEEVVEQEGPLDAERFLSVFRQLLDGMQAVHELDVLHRDIKPSNIMLKGDTPVLIDFGAARELATQRKAGFSALVTDGYSPIEQYSSQNIQGEASDIYALAATSHYLLTGEIPPMPAARMAGDQIKSTAEINPDLPEDIVRGIDWGLALQMADRPQTIRDWRAAMPSLDAVPTAEPEIVYVDRGGPGIDRRALLIGGAGVLLAVGAGSFLFLRDTSIGSSAQPLALQWTKDLAMLFGEPFAGISVAGEQALIAAHEFDPASGNDRALACRIDADGKETGRFVLDQAGSRAHSILPAPDGGAYLGGEIGSESMITRLDSNFRPLWTRKFESGSVSSIMPGPNGLVAGLEGPASSGKAKLLFVNSDGKLTADVTLLDRRGDSVQRVAPLSDGSIAVLGMRIESRVIEGAKVEVSSLWLAKIAQSGEELWRVAESGLGIANGWGVIEAGGNIYVTGRTRTLESASQTKLLLMRVSGDGVKDWARWDYSGEPASGRAFGLSPSGDLYVASWVGAPNRARIGQVGPAGDLLWDVVADDQVGFGDAYAGLSFSEGGASYAVYLRSETQNDLKLAIRKFA